MATGIPVDLRVTTPPPLCVDFVGNEKEEIIDRGMIHRFQTAYEVLILAPDGKLLVRSSRDDSDEDNEEAQERAQRYTAWENRLKLMRNPGITAPIPGLPGTQPGLPGVGTPPSKTID